MGVAPGMPIWVVVEPDAAWVQMNMGTQFKDYYKILGVSRQAGHEEIRKAFRRLARQYHPDVAKDKATAEQKFKDINEAYEVLGDPEKRKRYDSLGTGWGQAGGGWGEGRRPGQGGQGRRSPWSSREEFEDFDFHFGGTGFSDFFEQFFGTRGASGRRHRSGREHSARSRRATRDERGKDIEVDLMVTLEEAFHGTVRDISVQKGKAHGGRGSAPEWHQVRVPPGITDRQRLRLSGKGEKGRGHGLPGDLYLRVRLAQHPDFRVEGHNLYYDLNLAPWEAALGTEVTIPTLTESIRIRIPSGTQSGRQLRLRGHGMPRGGPGERGDLFVACQIRVPETMTQKERALWEQLAQESEFRPRE